MNEAFGSRKVTTETTNKEENSGNSNPYSANAYESNHE